MDFSSSQILIYLYSMLLSMWVSLSVWYLIGNIMQSTENVRRLHQLFTWACAVKSLSLAFKLVDSLTNESDPILQFWSISTEGLSCVFLFVTWALYSKGLMVTEADFDNIDLSSVSCMASAIYSVYCFYILNTKMLHPIILVMHCWLCFLFIKSIHTTQSILHSQLNELTRARVVPLIEVTKKKIKIFKRFATCIYAYFVLYIVIGIVSVSLRISLQSMYQLWATLWQFLLLIVMTLILTLLRPRDMGDLYYVSVANTVELQLAPFYSAQINHNSSESELNRFAPVVILTPNFQSHHIVLVGIPSSPRNSE